MQSGSRHQETLLSHLGRDPVQHREADHALVEHDGGDPVLRGERRGERPFRGEAQHVALRGQGQVVSLPGQRVLDRLTGKDASLYQELAQRAFHATTVAEARRSPEGRSGEKRAPLRRAVRGAHDLHLRRMKREPA